jgi:hypothetical protein
LLRLLREAYTEERGLDDDISYSRLLGLNPSRVILFDSLVFYSKAKRLRNRYNDLEG